MTTPVAEPSSRDVSFIGSLLRLNPIGNNFQTNPFFQHPTGLSNVARRPGVACFTAGMSTPLLKPTTPAPKIPPDDGDGDKEKTRKASSLNSVSDPMTPSSSPASTPRSILSKQHSRKTEEHQPKKKEKPAISSPSSSSVRAVEVKQENIKALSSHQIKHSRIGGCSCNRRPDNDMQIEPCGAMKKSSSGLIANIYYARPPPTLVEYRKRELVCYEKITDDLIDLTQSTIDMVQSLKKELRN